MTFRGAAAIDYLGSKITQADPAESSHWQRHHSAFRFFGDGFAGLSGFGTLSRSHRGLRRIAHRMLQMRFRRLAVAFPTFALVDDAALRIVVGQNRGYDLDALRQAITVAFLQARLTEHLSSRATACVIGDGYGMMTALLLATGACGRVVLVNLTKTLLVDLWYLRLWMGDHEFTNSVELVEGPDSALGGGFPESQCRVVAVQATDHQMIRSAPIDFAINIASMQEMNPATIADYFADLRSVAAQRRLAVYCCNRVEKTLPDGTQTKFFEYPWHAGDVILADERCPWHQYYYAATPPFYRAYDGPIHHRLVWLHGTPTN